MKGNRKICVGMIAGAHGVKGLVRLRSFTEDPEAVVQYGPLADEDGKIFAVKLKTAATDFFIAEVKGLKNKEEADALRGTKLYVPREAMPETDDGAFYETDLIGLEATDGTGKSYGKVQAVHNHGGGVFLEIGADLKNSFMLPFTDACVPEVDVGAGRVTIVVPEGWLTEDRKKERNNSPPLEGGVRGGGAKTPSPAKTKGLLTQTQVFASSPSRGEE